MKTFSKTDAVGYFIPECEYKEMMSSVSARKRIGQPQNRNLSLEHEETLQLYSQGKIGASEAKAELACDTRGLLEFLRQRELPLPHLSRDVAEKMAYKALALMNISIPDQVQQGRIS